MNDQTWDVVQSFGYVLIFTYICIRYQKSSCVFVANGFDDKNNLPVESQ